MLELIEEQKGKITVLIQDTNRLTATLAPEMKLQLSDVLKKNGVQLTLDLSNIKYVDSSGFGILISALKTARQNNSSLILNDVQEDVMSLMKLMKLDQIFDIVTSNKE